MSFHATSFLLAHFSGYVPHVRMGQTRTEHGDLQNQQKTGGEKAAFTFRFIKNEYLWINQNGRDWASTELPAVYNTHPWKVGNEVEKIWKM